MVDPNHVGKAICSQLVLGGSFTTIGETYFDVGLLSLAGVAKNVYQVDDFASDAVVLELCSKKTIEKVKSIANLEDRKSLLATVISLLFLRLFIVASSSSEIPKRHAIAIVWASMLYFTSINISTVTKRNIVAAAIPIICLLAQMAVTKIRLLTSEPAEHFFGCTRQKKRELTVSDFVTYTESLEIALCEMVQYDLRSSGGTGYFSTFSGFLKQCAGKTSKTHCSEEPVDAGKCGSFAGIDVSYDYNTKSVAEQIENEVIMDINSSNETMIAFLRNDLRTELSQQHAYTNGESIQLKEESELNDFNIDDADTTDAFQYAVNLALEDNESKANIHFDQFIPHGLQADALKIVSCEVDSSNSRNLWQILTKTLELVDQSHFQEASDLTQILSMVVECMGGPSRKSVVLNVFAKSYNKWRMEDLAPATNKTKAQAVAVKEHRFIPEQYKVDSTCDRKQRFISVGGNVVTPFAFIRSHGWISSGHAW